MKKFLCFCAAAIFALAGCADKGENIPDGEGIGAQNEVVYVDQNGQVDLTSVIKITPEGSAGELSFDIIRQPEYADGGSESYISLGDVYSLDGNILKSSNVRVPDVIEKNLELPTVYLQNKYQRFVLQGQLEVTLTLAEAVIDTKVYDIVQTNKSPLPAPTITFVNPLPKIDGVDAVAEGTNWKYTLELGSQAEAIWPYMMFEVMPIDYSPINLHLEPADVTGADDERESDHFISSGGLGQVWSASSSKLGTGYLVCIWAKEEETGYDLTEYDELIDQADAAGTNRIYVETKVKPYRLEGIKLNEDAVEMSGEWDYFTCVRDASGLPLDRFITALISRNGAAPEEVPYAIYSGGVWTTNPDWTAAGVVPSNTIVAGDFSGTLEDYPVVGTFATGSGTKPTTAQLVSATFPVGTVNLDGWRPQINRTFSGTTTPTFAYARAENYNFSSINGAGTQGVRGDAGTVKLTVTHRGHFLEDDWTFEMEVAVVLQADRNTLLVSEGQYYQP